jgi:hypothetical protein
MSRLKATKRKRNAQVDTPKKISKPSTVDTQSANLSNHLEPKSLNTLISEEELEIAVDTLVTLAKFPNVIKSKACKNLRVAVYDFKQACTTGVNTAGESILITLRSTLAYKIQRMRT